MDSSQSDESMRDEDYRFSDVDSQHSEKSPRNEPSTVHGHLSAAADRYDISPNDPTSGPRREFNKNRKIIIKNVPPVRYEEVKEFLGSYAVSNISISKRARHAVATLVHGEQAESAMEGLNDQDLMGTPVSVAIYPNECLLCVAHLPLNLDEADFRNMVSEYGAIERAFLMVNREGRSKGYGFVEFAHNKELSTQARNMLDGKRVGSCMLHCDFLDTSIVSFEHLQSRCLYIDHLPQGYDNEMELRNIFSFIKTPTFFRLHSSNSHPPNKGTGSFAVVEYETYGIAEDTQRQGNGLSLCQQRIRVTFCLPGRPGIDIFSTLLAAHTNNSKQALLPNPTNVIPGPTRDSLTNPMVFNLLAQSPPLLQNFQKMMQQLHQQTQPATTQKPGLLGMAPHLPTSPLMNPNLQVALLAVMLAMQLQKCEPSLMSNSQLQAMIASNLQNEQNNSGGSRPSLLGNPMIAQANSLIQNLATQQGSVIHNMPSGSGNLNGNISNLNINQLNNWNQLLGLLQTHLGNGGMSPVNDKSGMPPTSLPAQGQGLLGDAPNSGPMRKSPLLGVAPGMNAKPGLLGDAPKSLGRPILGSSADKRTLLGGQNQPALLADPGAKENINIGPANPLLAIFLEGQIRQQLDSLQGRGGGGPGPGGPGGPGPYGGGMPPRGPPNPHNLPNPHGPPNHQCPPHGPPNHQGPPHGPPNHQGPPHGPPNHQGPPHGPPNHQGPPNPHGPPMPHGPPLRPPLLPNQRPLAHRRPPRPTGPPGSGGSLLGQPHFPPQPHGQMSGPPPNGNLGAGPKPYKPLLPNPMPNAMMGPAQTRKPGLLGEHPGAPPPQRPQWQPAEENGPRPQQSFPRPNNTAPEKRGLLGDAPSNLQPIPDFNKRLDRGDLCNNSWSDSHSMTSSQGDVSSIDDWGRDLWETASQDSSGRQQSNISNNQGHDSQKNHNDNKGDSSPSSYIQQYQQMYQQYLNQYSQAAATIYPGGSVVTSPQEALMPDNSALLGSTPHMPPPRTPIIGVKRARPHLLPSPEASPEGNYIGQHSQGLGGHYATSYTKRRKLV